MIGFSPHPYDAPPNLPFHQQPQKGALKRLASSREELEQSWNPSQLLHSISRSADEVDRSFKRQRTDDSIDASSARGRIVNVRINPDHRPHHPHGIDAKIKPGWYSGQLSGTGNRHGFGTTTHDDGTVHTGRYADDVMDGWGCYTFTVVKQLVHLEGISYHRTTEQKFEGLFTKNAPNGKGMMCTTVIDVDANHQSTGRYVKVVYDVGYYKPNGSSVGEGIRFSYMKNDGGEWKEVCTRLSCGEDTGLVVGRSYGEWVCSCLGLESYPAVPSL